MRDRHRFRWLEERIPTPDQRRIAVVTGACGAPRTKSALIAEALTAYFAEKDRRELAAIYAEAAEDPLFRADNEAVLRDFAALDPDWDSDEKDA